METKDQVAAAARALFAADGYVATTIAAIARAADIPAPTIYSAFGGKADILRAIAWGVAGTLDIDRQHDSAIAEPDPARGLRVAAAIQRRQFDAMYDVVVVCQEAARTDPEIAAMVAGIATNRERAFRRHLAALADRLAVTVDAGVDVYLALVLPEVYRTLVVERGWTADRYETWLGDALVGQLLS
jgi:AcrR family transcriptional regulator